LELVKRGLQEVDRSGEVRGAEILLRDDLAGEFVDVERGAGELGGE